MRRPWKVFVRDIGPAFSFATEAAALDRARLLAAEPTRWVERCSSVVVYEVGNRDADGSWLRRIVTPSGEKVERFGRIGTDDSTWRWRPEPDPHVGQTKRPTARVRAR